MEGIAGKNNSDGDDDDGDGNDEEDVGILGSKQLVRTST